MIEEKEFLTVIDQLLETGINLSRLSEQMGMNRALLSQARKNSAVYGDAELLIRILKSKAKLLKAYHPSKHSLEYVCDEGCLKQSSIAKKLGISRQALNKSLQNPRADRLKAVKNILKEVGKQVENLASELEKKAA